MRLPKLKVTLTIYTVYIIIGGDLNGRNLEAIGDYPDVLILDSGPTRGDKKLDKIATKFNNEYVEVQLPGPGGL